MAMPLNIEDEDFPDPFMADHDYQDWVEEMHVDPFEILDDSPSLVEGEVEE